MKILRVYEFLPPNPGGMEKHILRLSQEQCSQGHDVFIAFNSGKYPEPYSIKILKKIRLRSIRPLFLRNFIFYFLLIIELKKRNLKFDVIHLHGDWGSFIYGRILKLICESNVLIGSIHDRIKLGKFWKLVYRISLYKFDFVYTTGKREFLSLSKTISSPVFWQNSGIDDLFYYKNLNNFSQRDIDICSTGSFLPKKNWRIQIEIAKQMPNLNFCFIGDGPLLNEFKKICKEAKIKNVEFTGNLAPNKVAEYLRRSKIFLMTSYYEGTPTALLEAIASGCIPIVSKSNDYSEIIPIEAGLIIDTFQSKEFIQAIELSLNPQKLNAINPEMICANAIRYSWRQVASNISNWITFYAKSK